jgi:tetratricopeptide (TPR) repeat protein
MVPRARPFRLFAPLVFALALSACDSAEERAEAHYQSGLKYVAAGEVEKALIEFRNVFKLNGEHLEARLEYARLLIELGRIDDATSQYLRVLEQDAGNRTARIAVAKAMLGWQNFVEAERHASAIVAIDPDDLEARAIQASAWLRLGRGEEAAIAAGGILAKDPRNAPALLVDISWSMDRGKLDEALAKADAAMALVPGDITIYLAKLAVLERQKNSAGITALLAEMDAMFPENGEITRTRIGWMLETGDIDGAEGLIRQIAAEDPANTEAALDVVGFLETHRGLDASLAELQRLAALNGAEDPVYERALATMMYRMGDADAAKANVEALLAATEDRSDANESKVLLGFFAYEAGDRDTALAFAEEVLKDDDSHVEALKLRAEITIDRDDYGAAIADLRKAAGADPSDPGILILEARAHDLNGSGDLARERLAEAVSISGARPDVAMAYAENLIQNDRVEVAETILRDSAGLYPRSREVWIALARARLLLENWTGAEAAAAAIRALSPDGTDADADNISVAVLQGQNRIDESLGLMREMMADSGEDSQAALLNIIRTHLEAGESDIAEKFLADYLLQHPGDYTASLLEAGVKAVAGDAGSAETIYRRIISEHPAESGGYVMLAELLNGQDRRDEGLAVVEAGLKATADTQRLHFMRATSLEARGDFEGAIEIYSMLYEQSPGSELLANNLASLLSEHRSDKTSLERAYRVSRRLADSDFAPYQDTYGWILYLRGDYERALAALNLAGEGLGDNPVWLYHFGMTQLKLNNQTEARDALRRAVSGAEAIGLDLPQIEVARKELAALGG